MNRYRIHATVSKTYIATEEVTFEVRAISEEEAIKCGQSDADDHAHHVSSTYAEHEETENEVNQVELIEGEDPDTGIPRCDKTPDMFQGEK